ncbi:hypothetical protein SGUI_1821 [Serinicoccus hydrothermalis]|uniref:Uncharacterized protein n=1 Tax=Serinicoccus hydrothermalis TaxID=1758689 RepID=A0A1B1NCQ5_9MICO|nr:hypothetical protein [Serinicoccus hydrothermalis]ANS79217.1 hypothetical protein SGUI_1821 [Serinicoccus hydrothermalis]
MPDLLRPALSAFDVVLDTTGHLALLTAAVLYLGYLLTSAVALVLRPRHAPAAQPGDGTSEVTPVAVTGSVPTLSQAASPC